MYYNKKIFKRLDVKEGDKVGEQRRKLVREHQNQNNADET